VGETVIEEKQEELELNVRELLNKDKHADIVFVVEDQHIFAHRLVVALRIASPVISAILASPNREHRVVGVGADVFLQLLRFAYGNGLYQLTSNPAFDQAFMRMLDALQITTFGRNQVHAACVREPCACRRACLTMCVLVVIRNCRARGPLSSAQRR
jgi:hypothetical protein